MMSVRHLGPLGMVVLAVLAAEAGSASEPAPLPDPMIGIAETVADAAGSAGQETGGPDGTADGQSGVATTAGHGTPSPRSRLIESLSDRASRTAPPSGSPSSAAADPANGNSGVAAMARPPSAVLFGCPRVLLAALLAEAAETGDAVSALAIERETLVLCRERQEIVTGIVTLEGELRTLVGDLPTERARIAASADVTSVDVAIVKESAPVRVVSLAPAPEDDDGAPAPEETAPPAPPAPSAYSWFSIIGTAGDLEAGVSDGGRVWFVREGDRLPGAVTVERIAARPPGVHVGGASEITLPYRPRPLGASHAGGGTVGMGVGPAGDGP